MQIYGEKQFRSYPEIQSGLLSRRFLGAQMQFRGNTAYNQSHLESIVAEGLRQKGPWYSKMGF